MIDTSAFVVQRKFCFASAACPWQRLGRSNREHSRAVWLLHMKDAQAESVCMSEDRIDEDYLSAMVSLLFCSACVCFSIEERCAEHFLKSTCLRRRDQPLWSHCLNCLCSQWSAVSMVGNTTILRAYELWREEVSSKSNSDGWKWLKTADIPVRTKVRACVR